MASAAAVFAARAFAPRRLPRVKIDDVGVFEHAAGAHVDTLARGGRAQAGTCPPWTWVAYSNARSNRSVRTVAGDITERSYRLCLDKAIEAIRMQPKVLFTFPAGQRQKSGSEGERTALAYLRK